MAKATGYRYAAAPQRISEAPICDWLRSCRVTIASGFSPRFAITHKHKAPEERSEFAKSTVSFDFAGYSSRVLIVEEVLFVEWNFMSHKKFAILVDK